MPDSLRIDKWLWTVRFYKTRSLATEACKAGKIKMEGQSIKPARELKVDDIITINQGTIIRTVKVLGFPANRQPAKLILQYMEDLTPQELFDRQKMINETRTEFRPRGLGRPTKKSRRLIDRLKHDGNQKEWDAWEE
ncbi:MAG: RNA-binding S4 domain-containing protein [Bacteroidota bacterium]|nr:RNA-binding S4 domain-containing protein [Bacteroidota bacterium]